VDEFWGKRGHRATVGAGKGQLGEENRISHEGRGAGKVRGRTSRILHAPIEHLEGGKS